MNRLLKRPSVPTVIATLALVFAMAGVAPAAKRMITGKDIAKNAVTTTHIKDHTLKAADFAPGVLKTGVGPAGPAGAPGAKGATGAQGAAGDSGAPGENGLDGAPGADGADGAPGADGANGQGPAYVHTFTSPIGVTTSAADVAALGGTTALTLGAYVATVSGHVSAASTTVLTCYLKVGNGLTLQSDPFTTAIPAGGGANLSFSWARMVPSGTVTLNCVGDHAATIDQLVLTAIQATTLITNA